MNLKEIIVNIQNIIAKGRRSQSYQFSDRQCLFIINYYYAKLVEQQLEKYGNNESLYQVDLGAIELEQIDRSKYDNNIVCNIKEFETSCILRSKIKIPKPVYYRNNIAINYLGTLDFLKEFNYHSVNKIKTTKHYKYTSNEPKWFLLNDYIYVVNPPTSNIKYIRVIGVFQNPLEAISINNDISNFNVDYPISSTMLDTIYKLMLETEIKVLMGTINDLTNDSTDDTLTTKK